MNPLSRTGIKPQICCAAAPAAAYAADDGQIDIDLSQVAKLDFRNERTLYAGVDDDFKMAMALDITMNDGTLYPLDFGYDYECDDNAANDDLSQLNALKAYLINSELRLIVYPSDLTTPSDATVRIVVPGDLAYADYSPLLDIAIVESPVVGPSLPENAAVRQFTKQEIEAAGMGAQVTSYVKIVDGVVDLTDSSWIEVEGDGCVYNGQAHEPSIKVHLNGDDSATLNASDYDASFSNNVNAGYAAASRRAFPQAKATPSWAARPLRWAGTMPRHLSRTRPIAFGLVAALPMTFRSSTELRRAR